MGETLVRLEGSQEIILERLTKSGLYKNKSEVIRSSILELGSKYKIFESLKELEDELAIRKMNKISQKIKNGKKKVLTEKEAKRKYGFE